MSTKTLKLVMRGNAIFLVLVALAGQLAGVFPTAAAQPAEAHFVAALQLGLAYLLWALSSRAPDDPTLLRLPLAFYASLVALRVTEGVTALASIDFPRDPQFLAPFAIEGASLAFYAIAYASRRRAGALAGGARPVDGAASR